MTRAWSLWPRYSFLALILILMLLEWLRAVPLPSYCPQPCQAMREEVLQLLLSKTFSAFAVALLCFDHLWLLGLNASRRNPSGQLKPPWYRMLELQDWCKLFLVLSAVTHFFWQWHAFPEFADRDLLLFGIDQSTNALVLLAGIVLGQWVEVLAPRKDPLRASFGQGCALAFALFLALASLVQNEHTFRFAYRAQRRATGLWANPNTFGLLMAMGLVLVLPYLLQGFNSARSGLFGTTGCLPDPKGMLRKSRVRSLALVGGTSLAAVLLGSGLIRSYSRGAWLAAVAGGAFVWSIRPQALAAQRSKGMEATSLVGWDEGRKTLVLLALLGCVLLAPGLALERGHPHPLTKRVASVTNANDFSWRNRLMAWKGALQITADHPMAGVGWQQAHPRFARLYMPAILTDPWSIILNDYLLLGMTLGIPALLCFLGLLWAPWHGYLHKRGQSGPSPASAPHQAGTSAGPLLAWRPQSCYGPLLVLLIGFGFDGGLFKLACAAPFWLFLELSQAPPQEGG